MPEFSIQHNPLDGYKFHTIPIDVHIGVVKIPTEEILDDYAIDNADILIVIYERQEVLDLQN